MGIVTIVELKKRMKIIYIICIIVGKFGYQKKLCPIVLLKNYEVSEISFYITILSLGLIMNLQNKVNKKPLLDFSKV